jgi:hypothetical protein
MKIDHQQQQHNVQNADIVHISYSHIALFLQIVQIANKNRQHELK